MYIIRSFTLNHYKMKHAYQSSTDDSGNTHEGYDDIEAARKIGVRGEAAGLRQIRESQIKILIGTFGQSKLTYLFASAASFGLKPHQNTATGPN